MTISERLGAFGKENKFISYNMTISDNLTKIPSLAESHNKTIIDNQNLININPLSILNLLHKKGAINGYQLADSKSRINKNKPLKNTVLVHYNNYLKTIKGQIGRNSENRRKKAESPFYKTFIPIEINNTNYAIKIKRAIYKDYLPKAPKDKIENWGGKSINYLFWDSRNIEKNIIAETKRELINKALNMPQISKITIRGIIGAYDSQIGGNMTIKSPFYLTNRGAINKPLIYSKICPISLLGLSFMDSIKIDYQKGLFIGGAFLTEKLPNSPLIDYQKLINNPIDYYSIYPKNSAVLKQDSKGENIGNY
jgi:hypothetical protein